MIRTRTISLSLFAVCAALLSVATHAHAYEPGDFICRVQDVRPDDGISFWCVSHDNTLISDGFAVGGDDWGETNFTIHTGDDGEPCNGTVTCDLEFGGRIFANVEPGNYIARLESFPSSADVKCFCR